MRAVLCLSACGPLSVSLGYLSAISRSAISRLSLGYLSAVSGAPAAHAEQPSLVRRAALGVVGVGTGELAVNPSHPSAEAGAGGPEPSVVPCARDLFPFCVAAWAVRGFPANKKENTGSPALGVFPEISRGNRWFWCSILETREFP